jgi:hypothetical protein
MDEMKFLMEIKEKLMKELEIYSKRGNYTISDLEKMQKLTDTVKNICKIKMLGSEEEGNSYRDGYSERHDRMGRYARSMSYAEEGGSNPVYRDGMSYARGYSYHDAKDHMMKQLGGMMESADESQREILKRCMRELEHA